MYGSDFSIPVKIQNDFGFSQRFVALAAQNKNDGSAKPFLIQKSMYSFQIRFSTVQ
ncbi:hypothetical protein HMPREF0766_12758 [Sphingobacterium spiritivorum ATCC 33861]|uniref:Uncharacterized protein n=1 Tax=Sphingobacterium spiritivorum ATCC 33861 TaxID=525373 RepID=D7VP38_SPHSI|nr:hypothetical protein HMPREF0766_12758 [Sphingobacterium spiritivorum ATCC 33861]